MNLLCIASFLISICLRNILIILGANCNWYRFSVLMNFISTILTLAVVGLGWSLLRGKEGTKFLLSSHPVPHNNWLATTPNPGNNWQNWCHVNYVAENNSQFHSQLQAGKFQNTWVLRSSHYTSNNTKYTMSISYHSLRVVLSVVVKVWLLI